jgi:hypothetical protein
MSWQHKSLVNNKSFLFVSSTKGKPSTIPGKTCLWEWNLEDTISIPVNMFFQESHWALVEDTNKK